ncbi:hypothetical protein [Streptomyces sp. NBC_01443]|uniref:hypothetical protein n=1 Tax=Streptomyces sp. NBC_01443 TaxID=2903868 RepID=UPI0022599773|nr:hypothetical protein [Streptomyces sp. NBC_01443]MCX4632675.1 hypothetical protein [Streptomyces sp. NBC_01443]
MRLERGSGRTDPEPGRIPAARRRLAHAYGEQLAVEMEQSGRRSGPVGRDAATLSAFALSLVVHMVTVVLAVIGILLVVLGWDTGVQPVVGVLLLGLAAVLRPRPARLPKDAPVLYRVDAPRLFESQPPAGRAPAARTTSKRTRQLASRAAYACGCIPASHRARSARRWTPA